MAGTVSLRFALAPEIGLSLGGMYMVGLAVKNKPLNQISLAMNQQRRPVGSRPKRR